MGRDRSSPGIESQGHRARLGLGFLLPRMVTHSRGRSDFDSGLRAVCFLVLFSIWCADTIGKSLD